MRSRTLSAHSARQILALLIALAALGAFGALVVTLTAPSGPAETDSTRAITGSRAPPPIPLFSAQSVWNRELGAGTAIDPASTALVTALVAEIRGEESRGIGPWIATTKSSTPLYRVAAGLARVRVTLDAPATIPGARALQSALAAVPIPAGARPAPGTDAHLTVWQPSSDTLWELFHARLGSNGWHALWGGVMRDVSRSPGYYTPAAWPGATDNWGSTATSLPVIGGTILREDLRAGVIDHALAISLPAPRAGVFAWPAQRSDGTGGPQTIPEGGRLRLDPRLDIAALHLPALTAMIALAAQRYGIIVRDQTHIGTTFYGEDPGPAATIDYGGAGGYYGGRTPLQLLARFPWSALEVIDMHLCTSAPCQP